MFFGWPTALVVHQFEWKRAEISAPLMRSHCESTRKRAAGPGIKRSPLQLCMKVDLQAFRLMAISELTDNDKLCRDNNGAHANVLDKLL